MFWLGNKKVNFITMHSYLKTWNPLESPNFLLQTPFFFLSFAKVWGFGSNLAGGVSRLHGTKTICP